MYRKAYWMNDNLFVICGEILERKHLDVKIDQDEERNQLVIQAPKFEFSP